MSTSPLGSTHYSKSSYMHGSPAGASHLVHSPRVEPKSNHAVARRNPLGHVIFDDSAPSASKGALRPTEAPNPTACRGRGRLQTPSVPLVLPPPQTRRTKEIKETNPWCSSKTRFLMFDLNLNLNLNPSPDRRPPTHLRSLHTYLTY
jgi:hypothetical protein